VPRAFLEAQSHSLLELLLLRNGRRGQQWSDYRLMINSIWWKVPAGAPRRRLLKCFGPLRTLSARVMRRQRDGTRDWLAAPVQIKSDARGWRSERSTPKASRAGRISIRRLARAKRGPFGYARDFV
jgi:hypothetical protein